MSSRSGSGAALAAATGLGAATAAADLLERPPLLLLPLSTSISPLNSLAVVRVALLCRNTTVGRLQSAQFANALYNVKANKYIRIELHSLLLYTSHNQILSQCCNVDITEFIPGLAASGEAETKISSDLVDRDEKVSFSSPCLV